MKFYKLSLWYKYASKLVNLFLKDFIDQKRDEKMYKKVWSDISVYNTINREEIRRSRRWYTIQRRLLLISSLWMVLYTEISDQTFLYIFSSRFWSIKSFKTLSECESRIVGRSPNFSEPLMKMERKLVQARLRVFSLVCCY